MTVLDNVLVGMHSRMHTSFAEILLRTRNFHTRENGARSRAMELIELTGLVAVKASGRTSSPTENNAGSRSRGPWPQPRSCCCSMSRLRE